MRCLRHLACRPRANIVRSQFLYHHAPIRFQSSTPGKASPSTTTPFEVSSDLPATGSTISPRWLSDAKRRIGKCISFGLNPSQVKRAGELCALLGRDWKELLVGSEGFLVRRAGLLGQRVVWGEMDSMGHVNNVMYTRYAESARVEWVYNFATSIDPDHKNEWSELWTPRGVGMILRSIKTDYKFPMTWPDRISVFHKLRLPPSNSADSFILDVMILSERYQRPAARCVEDIVVYDYKKGQKTPLRPFMAEAFEETYRLQEEARNTNTQRILELLGKIEDLENESWGRKDAQEDFGSAT